MCCESPRALIQARTSQYSSRLARSGFHSSHIKCAELPKRSRYGPHAASTTLICQFQEGTAPCSTVAQANVCR
jgi:hypothetical protein